MDHKGKVGEVGVAGAVGDLGTNAPSPGHSTTIGSLDGHKEKLTPVGSGTNIGKLQLVTHITGKQK